MPYSLMPTIRNHEITAIQRLLLVRRSQVNPALTAIGRFEPDIVEMLPSVILPQVIRSIPTFAVPLLAGGFSYAGASLGDVTGDDRHARAAGQIH